LRDNQVTAFITTRFMTVFLYPFMALAAFGFVLSVTAHAMALMGLSPPGGDMIWSLHVGIFVVWIPTVLVSMRTVRNAPQKDFWKIALAGCPTWMRKGLYGLFAYAIVNFALFIFTQSNSHHASTAETLPSQIRGFSGHWMVFYGAAFATLYSAIHAPHLFRERKCSQGHVVSPSAQFCAECGRPVPKDAAGD